MSEVLIKAENVSKKFCKDLKKSLKYGFQDLGNMLSGGSEKRELRKDEFWAVKNISFEIKRGECLGLIGHNGAGKSTLLKMLNGLINPDEGSITMKGKVGALIELGAGFNPILTGLENIYNNAAILGFTKEETDARLKEIIEFAELENFMDMPIQNYSSGMRVRLGFAIAAQLQPDILLIDEVLAVGDMGFVLKCFNKMDKLLSNTAMIFVSHSMPQVARMATKVLMLEKGEELFYSNDVASGLTEYYNRFKLEIGDFKGSDLVELIDIKVTSENITYNKEDEISINYGSDMELEIEIICKAEIQNPEFYLAFYDKEQRNFAEVFSETAEMNEESVHLFTVKENQKIKAKIKFNHLELGIGKYSITIALNHKLNNNRETLFRYQSAIYFSIKGKRHGWAPMQFNNQFELQVI